MSGYRPCYTLDEENTILEAIVVTQSYLNLRTKAFWVDLEESRMIARTWQSMKERFEKSIVSSIGFRGYKISEVDKKLIQLGYLQTQSSFTPNRNRKSIILTDSSEESASDEI